MMLSGDAIKREVTTGEVIIDPFRPELLKPTSYVLTMGKTFRRWPRNGPPLLVWNESGVDSPPLDETRESITLEPGEVILVASAERVSIPSDLVGLLSTLSHLARFGVSVHCNSYLVAPGFGRREPTVITLELTSANARPIVLTAGIPLCHLAFMRVESPIHDTDGPLGESVYSGDVTPSGPKLVEEFGPILGTIGQHQATERDE